MKIATFNVNSLRKRLPTVLDWLASNAPDVLCLQETKVQDADFPLDEIIRAGYHVSFRGIKSYAGVATLTREAPEHVSYAFDESASGDEGRFVQITLGGITIVNTYVPQGSSIHSDRYVEKLSFLQRLRIHFATHLSPEQPVIWLGDLNVAPEPIDVYHPDRRTNDPDFHIDARDTFKAVASWGLTDVYRHLHPDRVQYTYWDYFRNAYANNWGWRIDHIMVTAPLLASCRQAEVDVAPREAPGASDHTIVWAQFDWPIASDSTPTNL